MENEENQTYRFLRRKPTIMGLSVPRFFLFLGVIIITMFIVIALFHFFTIILGLGIIGASYVYLSKPQNTMQGSVKFPNYIQKYGNHKFN